MIDARTAFQAAVEIGRTRHDGILVAEAARGIGGGWNNGGSPDAELLGALELAIKLLGPEYDGLRTHLRGRLAAEQRHLLPSEERDRLTTAALEHARKDGDERALAEALIARHQVMVGAPRIAERVSLVDELIGRAGRSGDREAVLQGLVRRYSDLMELGDRDGAEASLLDYEALAARVGQPFFIYSAALAREASPAAQGRPPRPSATSSTPRPCLVRWSRYPSWSSHCRR